MVNEGIGQKELFVSPEDDKQKKVDEVFDRIKKKYGDDKMRRGG